MTRARNKAAEPTPPANAPGDNRGAEDVDGNKAGAAGGNKAKGPNAPEVETGSTGTAQK